MKINSARSFCNDWKFLLGDPKNAQYAGYNDHTWQNVNLPHDWVIYQPFSWGQQEGWTPQNMQGFFAWEGICWYRKEFEIDNPDGKAVYIFFGCAYRNSTVFVNGKKAGGRANGYLSFDIDITDFVKQGKNLLAVRLDNGCEEPDRWYSGSGLFRSVSLKIVPLIHIKTNGIQITVNSEQLNVNKYQFADICIFTTIINRQYVINDNTHKGYVNVKIFDKDDNCAAEDRAAFNINGINEITIDQKLRLDKPLLWSAKTPDLYRAVVWLEIDDESEAHYGNTVRFGVRNIEIAYNKGMTVNGEKVKLKGVCLHHDCGITGAAHYDDVWRRRFNILKSIGCNAIRTSHNPPPSEFLDLCDETGFYVINECFDKWKSGYYASHFDTDAEIDLTDFIIRDRNHPSVFMWSVGNEVEEQSTPPIPDAMIAVQKKLVDIAHKLDSRPVTCALAPHANPRSLVNAPVSELVKLTKKLAKDVDVLGLNYHEPLYQAYTDGIEKPIAGTECYEYYSSVGANFEDISDKNPWQFVLENENVIGQFIWAGIDYLGESSWPAKGWTGAILDICGFLKPNAFFRKSIWTDEPFIYMAFYDQNKKPDYARGRWSFPQMTSHLNHLSLLRRCAKTAIFTNCEEAELFINGKKAGIRKRADFKNGIIEWNFEYAYGTIEVKGFIKGKEVCNYILKTAENAKRIKLTPDFKTLKPNQVAHIEVNITDKNEILCQTEDILIEFSIKGDAVFMGACSSDLNQNTGFTSNKVITSEGRALAMIKAGGNTGNVELCAYSEKLEKTKLLFKVNN